IARAACDVARELKARALVAFTLTGGTPRLISKARPAVPVIAFSPAPESLRRLALYWGVLPQHLELITNFEELVVRVTAILRHQKVVASGDCFVMAYGSPLGQGSPTNSIRVVQV
ncbi:MAG TPA: pyruvate kinase alpha/beta domain-containing protein, partial [Polyangia bacterium]|nr:pyruvate kinase alpha/beta domain-containing protein [Polyangia bacterium]